MYMNLLEHVRAHSYSTKAEWIAALHAFGDQAETTHTALKKAKSDRQQTQRDYAKEAEVITGQALSWLEYDTWPSGAHRSLEAIADHIRDAIKAPKAPL